MSGNNTFRKFEQANQTTFRSKINISKKGYARMSVPQFVIDKENLGDKDEVIWEVKRIRKNDE